MDSKELNQLTRVVIGHAMTVHTALGPGLYEHVYKECLRSELVGAGLRVQVEASFPVTYDLQTFDVGFRVDLLVESQVIVELKSSSHITDVHRAQLLTYLRLSDKRVGLLLNFGTNKLREGIVRMVNNFTDPRPSP